MKRFLLSTLAAVLFTASAWAGTPHEFISAAKPQPQITEIVPTGFWDSGRKAWVERNSKRITVTLDGTASRKAVAVLLQKAIEAEASGADTDPNDADGVTGTWDHGGLEFGEFGEIDATVDYSDPNAPVLTLTSASITIDNRSTNEIPFAVTTGDDDPNAATGTPTNTQEATGPLHFDDDDNWIDTSGTTGVPDPNDTLVWSVSSGSVYFGLENSDLNQRIDTRNLQGNIGLRAINSWQSTRPFREDRTQYLVVEPNGGGTVEHNIGGRGPQQPTGYRKFNFGSEDPTLIVCNVHDSASATSDGAAVQIVGGKDIELNVYKGSISTGALASHTAPTRLIRLQTFHVSNINSDADVVIESRTTFVDNAQNVNLNGGKTRLDVDCDGSLNEISIFGGTLTVMPTSRLNDLFCFGGTVDYRGTQIADAEVHRNATLDLSKCEETGLSGNLSLYPGYILKDPKLLIKSNIRWPGGNPTDGTWEVRRDFEVDITPL